MNGRTVLELIAAAAAAGWRYDVVCLLRDLLDAPTALAACCGFDLCHKYILYLVFGIWYFRGP